MQTGSIIENFYNMLTVLNRASLNENSNEHPQPARLWIIMITHTCNILCSFYGCKKGNFQMKNCDFLYKMGCKGVYITQTCLHDENI